MRYTLLVWICFSCLQCSITSVAWGQAHSSLQLVQVQDHSANWGIQLHLLEEGSFDAKALKVYVADTWAKKHQAGQAIAGRTAALEAHNWLFTPYLPFTEGMAYVATYAGLPPFHFRIPKTKRPSTWLTAVFPEQDTIPENTLKLYLHFSGPMSVGQSYHHLSWLNAAGDTLELPFLPLEPELWNEDRTRLTLWLDPGRVKRDLVPNQLMGAPLVNGQHYTLQIDQRWKDKYGKALAQEVQKVLVVGPADRTKPSPASWQLEVPPAASRKPLEVHFGEALDHALLQHCISLLDDQQEPILGTFFIEKGDETYFFYPSKAWAPGRYTLRIASTLEDLAGNNLNRPFDRDLAVEQEKQPEQAYFYLNFDIPDL